MRVKLRKDAIVLEVQGAQKVYLFLKSWQIIAPLKKLKWIRCMIIPNSVKKSTALIDS